MPRGAKRDVVGTAILRKSGQFLDSDSFLSVDGHLFLEGKDRSAARVLAIQLATNSRGAVCCQNCGGTVWDDVSEISPYKAEMHHLNRKPRCDCAHNLEIWCRACHRGAKGSVHP